jgi:uncharacterized LabA/DUF88 family protein
MERVKVFIDNSNMYKCLAELYSSDRRWIKQYDPLFLSKVLTGERKLIGTNFYCTNPPQILLKTKENIYWSQMNYYKRVEELEGVNIFYGNLTENEGKYFEKNLDTQMAVDIVRETYLNIFDTIILVSSDGDFESSVRLAKDMGKRVEVLFFEKHFSSNLKRVSDINRRARISYFRKI